VISDADALDDFFAGHPDARGIAATVAAAVGELGPSTLRVTRSQVAFVRRRAFAWLWRPGQYVRSSVPVVLSVSLPHRDDSPRWKEVVHPTARRWMHHLELRAPEEVDDTVRGWLAAAHDAAG
jgi:hypothetical protein